jgi:AcrR family transcriptional regulator
MPVVTEQHREARRRQILDAAVECFMREGFHRTTMQDIISEAGLSAGAIYGYFESKAEIIEAISAERHQREAALIDAAEEQDDVADTVREIARLLLLSLSEEGERRRRRLGVQAWAEALRNPKILKQVRGGSDRARRRFAGLVLDLQREGQLSAAVDADSFARTMIALFQGFVLQQAWDPKLRPEPYLQTVELLFDALLAYEPAR